MKVTPLAAMIVSESMFSAKSVLRLSFLFAFLLSTATADTQVTFPSFSPKSNGDFSTFEDAAYNLANHSYIINVGARTPASKGSCGALVYGKPVRIQNAETGRVASFSTSFSFAFTTHGLPWDNKNNPLDGSGFAFSFLQNVPISSVHDVVSQMGTFGACTSFGSKPYALNPPRFTVRFDTDYSPIHSRDPSNNFIRVARNSPSEYDVEAYTHNLCGNDTHCTYFSNGRTFTAWIDFTSSSQTLEIRMADGSNPKRSLQPLLLISNYKLPKSIGREVFVAFWGSSDVNHREEHELLSWRFFSTEISESRLQMMLHYWKSRTGVGIIIGGVLVATMAALVILWSIYSFATPSTSYSPLGYSTRPQVFSYKELRKATENFGERNLLGRGGSGPVYKGSLGGGGVLVAVKQINMSESKQAKSLFHAEVASLGQIRHRNVVRLQGWCQEKGKLLLVYEYISNGTLNQWLHENGSQQVLSLKMRHSILEGVGAALEYLHEDSSCCILHRDIKSSNVLLDADFKAYVGDFGLARLMDHHKLDKTTVAAGTFGYMAPELPYTGKATKESDVYSFGILVMEVVCGRHPLDLRTIEPEDVVLLFTVWQAHERGSLFKLADPRMIAKAFQPSSKSILLSDETTYATQVPFLPSNSYNLNCSTDTPTSIDEGVDFKIQIAMVVSLLQLGLFCCLPNPKARPSMGEVNRLLKQIQDIGNASSITTIPMTSLPAIKPPGIYHSLEFSNSVVLSTSIAPSPTSLV